MLGNVRAFWSFFIGSSMPDGLTFNVHPTLLFRDAKEEEREAGSAVGPHTSKFKAVRDRLGNVLRDSQAEKGSSGPGPSNSPRSFCSSISIRRYELNLPTGVPTSRSPRFTAAGTQRSRGKTALGLI